jgi:hypothetical protein
MSFPNQDPLESHPGQGRREITVLALMAVMVGLAVFGLLLVTGTIGGTSL